jgi:large subunit ribosomal protein L3
MQGLIGKKIGMTRIFSENGKAVAVTVIQAGNNIVHQLKTKEKDGYVAVQLGFEDLAEKKVNKAMIGHCKKNASVPTYVVKEFSLDNDEEKLVSGQRIGVESLENVKFVNVVGVSKGRGHTGTIKRYNFQRGRESHGNTNVRERGSSGANTYPARVMPGLKMSGHSGDAQVTARRLEVVGLDKEAGLLFVKGAVPGRNKGYLYIQKTIIK